MIRKVSQTPAQIDARLKDAAKMYEKQFLGEMVKAMRKTLPEGGVIQANMAEKIFQEQLDQQHVEEWGDRGGIGLSDLIYNQLMDKYGSQLGIKEAPEKPQGPLPLNQMSEYQGWRSDTSGSSGDPKGLQWSWSPEKTTDNTGYLVTVPWAGNLLGSYVLDSGSSAVEVQHENGLKSRILFNGTLSNLERGQKLEPGQKLGFMSPASSLHWSLSK